MFTVLEFIFSLSSYIFDKSIEIFTIPADEYLSLVTYTRVQYTPNSLL